MVIRTTTPSITSTSTLAKCACPSEIREYRVHGFVRECDLMRQERIPRNVCRDGTSLVEKPTEPSAIRGAHLARIVGIEHYGPEPILETRTIIRPCHDSRLSVPNRGRTHF